VLCGMYNGSKAARISRACNCPFDKADDPKFKCKFITVAEVESVKDDPNKQQLTSHHGINNAFHDLDFGAERIRGVHYCTPVDCMHQTRLGLAKYVLIGYFETMGRAGLWRTDRALKAIARLMRQSSRSRYPRSDFTKGFTNLKLMTAQEFIGGLFCLSVLFATQFGRAMFKTYCKVEGAENLQKFRKAFQYLLVFDAWSRGTTFWDAGDKAGVAGARKAIRDLLVMIKEAYPRYNVAKEEDIGHGLKLSKFHEALHIPSLIESFGSPANFSTESGEFHHKEQAKRPAAHAQKNHTTFTLQAGYRLFEDGVIRRLVQESRIDFSDMGTCVVKTLGNYMPPPPPIVPLPLIYAADDDDTSDEDDDDSQSSDESDDFESVEGFESVDMYVSSQASKFRLTCNESEKQPPFFILLKQERPSKIRFKEGKEVPFGLAAFVKAQLYCSDDNGVLVPLPQYKNLTLLSEYVKVLGTVRYVYRAHFSYRQTGPWFDWVWAVAQNKRYPVRVYCFLRYTDTTTGKAKAYAIVQGGDPRKNKIPKVNKTSAITRDFEIKGKRSKRALNQVPKTYPHYRIIPCTDLQETCCVIPNIKEKKDPLLADPSACEDFLLVAEYEQWQSMFIKFKMNLRE
jgi:hypothetical protein